MPALGVTQGAHGQRATEWGNRVQKKLCGVLQVQREQFVQRNKRNKILQ